MEAGRDWFMQFLQELDDGKKFTSWQNDDAIIVRRQVRAQIHGWQIQATVLVALAVQFDA
jgi:hypothetical protein